MKPLTWKNPQLHECDECGRPYAHGVLVGHGWEAVSLCEACVRAALRLIHDAKVAEGPPLCENCAGIGVVSVHGFNDDGKEIHAGVDCCPSCNGTGRRP